MLIKDAGRSGNISEQDLLSSSSLLSGGKAMDNEIQILKSLSLLEKVVDKLGLGVSYYRIGKLKESELYHDSPFILDSFAFENPDFYSFRFYIEMEDYNTFIFKKNEKDENGKSYNYSVPFTNEYGSFIISLSPKVAVLPGLYRVNLRNRESGAYKVRSSMQVKRVGDQSASSVLELTYRDAVPEKARDILNTVIDTYNDEEIKDENRVFTNTLDFIDNRIAQLIIELDSVEGGIQQYKSRNEIINNSASESMRYTLGEIRGAIQNMSQYEIKQNILESLEKFMFEQEDNTSLIPANLNAEEPALGGLVAQYNELVLQNNQMAISASELNPARNAVLEQIGTIRNLILKTIRNLKQDLSIPMNEIEDNINSLRKSISNIPGIEKRLVEKVRMQEVKEGLFLYLLQKKEETALSEAVTTAKTRIIDRARASKVPVYPRGKMVRSSAIALGLIFPSLFILGLMLFQNKIDSMELLKRYTNIPILGKIGLNKSSEPLVVKAGSRSAINEMFRLLRTNLNFINQGKTNQAYLVTSSFSGEGKTFIALNLALTLALSKKKVVIVGLDLRKPKLKTYLKAEEISVGLTNYLVGQSELSTIISKFKENEDLHFIPCGPIPPNPAELIMSSKMTELINELKATYDYVIIDTPPIGLVADALLLRKLVDNVLVIVRHKLTRKEMVKDLEQMYQKGELENSSIIYNGAVNGKRYYGYGGYKYGSKSGYYIDD